MVAGVVLLALGMKKVLEHRGGLGGHKLGDRTRGAAAGRLYAGMALYLLAHVAFRLCTMHTGQRPAGVCGVALVALIPLASQVLRSP